MRLKIRNELILLNLLVIVLILAVIFFPSNVLRVILGIPIVLFFPGYALMAALFPRKEGIGSIERVALSLVMSIAIVPLIGLILNYTPLGIKLESIVYSLASFIFIMSGITWLRRKSLLGEERFSIEFHLALPGWSGGTWNKVLSVTLVVAILGALGILGYVIATPKVGERFTEFYFLRQESREGSYPRELSVGEEGRVVVGIANNEYKIMNYWVEIRINGARNKKIEGIILEHGDRWENEVSFVLEKVGGSQKVEFLLYKNGETEPYFEPLRLWIDVRAR